jgi:prepilin-type N-terminal cleavage/methylation domain-containing protein
MMARPERSPYRQAVVSSCPERRRADGGFTLVEVMISMLILTIGLVAIAGLLGVVTQMQIGARESARSTRIAQDKIDELMKLNFSSDPAVAIGGDLASDVTNYSETPLAGITLRWAVAAGPTDDLRVLTLRVENLRTLQYRETDLTTIIRKW